jgi:hypothetical protein
MNVDALTADLPDGSTAVLMPGATCLADALPRFFLVTPEGWTLTGIDALRRAYRGMDDATKQTLWDEPKPEPAPQRWDQMFRKQPGQLRRLAGMARSHDWAGMDALTESIATRALDPRGTDLPSEAALAHEAGTSLAYLAGPIAQTEAPMTALSDAIALDGPNAYDLVIADADRRRTRNGPRWSIQRGDDGRIRVYSYPTQRLTHAAYLAVGRYWAARVASATDDPPQLPSLNADLARERATQYEGEHYGIHQFLPEDSEITSTYHANY